MQKQRIGWYAWAGPGLERITKLKFFDPKIDTKSLYRAYDFEYLKKVKEVFGITDAWVTYSWGFSDKTEKEDKEFILGKLKNFRKLKIKTHAYIQGPNLVTADFEDKDYFCIDEYGNRVPYYRGRTVCCVNNPEFQKFIKNRIEESCQHDFDGIFIDNIQMGKLGIPGGKYKQSYTVGCSCKHCQKKFKNQTGQNIPKNHRAKTKLLEQYFQFRADSTTSFVKELYKIARKYKKEFGTNSYDPKFDTKYVFGTDLKEIDKIQDYLLFENHSLPNKDFSKNNLYISELVKKENLKKPVFIVSYKKVIGFDSEFDQFDFERILSESEALGYYPCLKGSEFVTNGLWHNLYINKYKKASLQKIAKIELSKEENNIAPSNLFARVLIKRFGLSLQKAYFENKLVRKIGEFIHKKLL